MLRYAIIALITLPLLSGCGPTLINAGAADVIEYPPEFQDKVANEVETNSCPASVELLKDYSVMRDQSRVSNRQLSSKDATINK